MAKTEFEESEYEGPLYNQLLNGNLRIWTPGRMFERIVGIDSAVFANNQYFWSLFGSINPISGISLRDYDWHFLWHLMTRVFRPFPKFKINLLIQAKRPTHIENENIDYCAKGICGEFWYFFITTHQQAILEKLEQKLALDALVIYACPAFHQFAALDNNIETGQIVENSTFVKPSALVNHTKWVFNSPGTTGLACSKINEHSDKPFIEMLEDLERRFETKTDETSKNNLEKLKKIIETICTELPENSIIKAYLKRNERLVKYLNEIKSNIYGNSEVSYMDIVNFMSLTQFMVTANINWYSFEE